ncbi:GNAT family N-acetyltransferase [Acinetobacter sp. AYS6]|uniref:GNAT family N-acetyltransferase n=1 Tax=Acinetobacter sp. AYS6 TaxID=2983297 RepID=UPI0021D67834|nr:GNAT family N-acetyltransferase [Acinetobacter sp. AYS6]MCU7696984.1 GNAT family N-acetyltransferase [Acinetobacter sp. AYS6]
MVESLNMVVAGYSSIPAGHIASVVTCLEMLENPINNQVQLPEGFSLCLYNSNDLDEYRNLFRLVGSDWLWFSRLLMSDEQLTEVLNEPTREIYVIRYADQDVGLLELDFGVVGEAELVFLGLTSTVRGKGIGRAVMDTATSLAWKKPIQRFWVHTCTFDHPSALGFYIRSGFKPYALKLEVQADPRLSGHLPLSAAAHVPVIT